MRREDIVLLDGAIGTGLWEKADDKVPVWRYNIENPAIVKELAREYAEAGSQIIHTNTFSANRITLQRSDYTVKQVVSAAVRLAKEALGDSAKASLDIGPLPMLMEPYGDLTEEEAFEMFDEQISAGVTEKPDLITLETFSDADMLRIAAEAAAKHSLPIFTMMTFTEVGKTIMGHSVERFIETIADLPVTIFKPNAGKPILAEDGSEKVQYDVDTFVEDSMPALEHDVKYIGGCCGSSPAYIRALKNKIFEK